MGALAFWKAVVQDRSNFLERIIGLLDENQVRYCVVGGVAVNAYAAPVVTEDLDIVIAVEQLAGTRKMLEREFRTQEFAHSLNVYDPNSGLQVQLQTDPGLPEIVERAERRDVMGLKLPVAAPLDLIRLKVAAALEPTRRPSKRQKDLADISRLREAFPELDKELPPEIRERLFE